MYNPHKKTRTFAKGSIEMKGPFRAKKGACPMSVADPFTGGREG
jgi:hypothetical protein